MVNPDVTTHRYSGQRKPHSSKTTQLRNNYKNRYTPSQGTQLRMDSMNSGSTPEEEFFCLTPEDARSIASGGSGRSRNASATSTASAATIGKSSNMKPNFNLPIQMGLPDTKIFSVAVEARPAEHTGTDTMVVCDVDTDYAGRFAVVSSCYPNKPSVSDYQRKEAESKISSKRLSETNKKHRVVVQEQDKRKPSMHPNAEKINKYTKVPSINQTLISDTEKLDYTSSVSTLPKAFIPEISSTLVPEAISSHEYLKTKASDNNKSDSNDKSKSNKKGKKKKKGGNTQSKSGSPSCFDPSTNFESVSSTDIDAPSDNSSTMEPDKNKNLYKKDKDSSTKDIEKTDTPDHTDKEYTENQNEESDLTFENTDVTVSTKYTSPTDNVEVKDETILDLDETLSSAFADNPREEIELLKDGSQQSFDNMSTEELLAEALQSTTHDDLKEDCGDSKLSDDEKFSSEFSKTLTIRDTVKDEEDEDDLEETFLIKERSPDSDDITSSDENEDASEKDKSTEDAPLPMPLVDPEKTAHPFTKDTSVHISNIQSSITMLMPTPAKRTSSNRYENLFASDKQTVADSGSDIINKIKLAEKIYDNNTEEEELPEKSTTKKAPRSFASALNADLHLSAKGFVTDNKKPYKHPKSAETSEDDLEITIQPSLSRKQKRQKKHAAAKTDLSRRTSGASFADSESSLIDEDERNLSFESEDCSSAKDVNQVDIATGNKPNQEGWSFEADDLDVNRLIAEVVNDTTVTGASFIEGSAMNQNEKHSLEEKACLDEVFKFDSELAVAGNVGSANSEDDDNMEDCTNQNDKTKDSKNQWNNLNTEEETSEDDNTSNIISNPAKNSKMSKSLNVKVDVENNKIEKDGSSDNDNAVSSTTYGSNKIQYNSKGLANLSQSLVLGTTTEGTTSESSVGNSPNPRKTTKKSKKQKKKKF